jgi:glycosyltransferase involved in cell wall biosynthesis
MIKIALISHQAFALINFRKSLLEKLVKSGSVVYAFAPDFTDENSRVLLGMGVVPVKYSLDRTGFNPLKDFFDTVILALSLRKLKIDVTLGFAIKPVIFGTIAAYIAGVSKRIVMIEGLGYVFTEGGESLPIARKLLRKFVIFLYAVSLRKAHKVIFLNQDDMTFFINQKIIKSNNCLNLRGIGVDVDYWPQIFPTQDPITFVLVARLLREKGVYEYVDAIKKIKNLGLKARFLLLGDIDSNPGSISSEEVLEWVAQGLLDWPGHVDIKKWIMKCSVFVLPSYREGLPRSTMEAMSAGLPVITTDVPGCRETVIDGVNGLLIPPYNSEALAEAMKNFIENPGLITSMGRESRRIAVGEFNVHEKDFQVIKCLGLKF